MVFVGALTHVLQKNSDLNINTQCLLEAKIHP